MKIFILPIALSIFLQSNVIAQQVYQKSGIIAGIGLGGGFPKVSGQNINIIKSPYEALDVGVNFGKRINRHLAVNINLDYAKFRVKNINTQTSDDPSAVYNIAFNHGEGVKSLSVGLSMHYSIVTSKMSNIEPYFIVGVGVGKNKIGAIIIQEASYINNVKQGDTSVFYHDSNRRNITWKIGLGIKHRMNNNMFIATEYFYKNLGKIEASKNNDAVIKHAIDNTYISKLKSQTLRFAMYIET